MTRAGAVWLAAFSTLALTAVRAQGPVAFGQDPAALPKGSGVILGQVVDATTNRPIANAIIGLSSGPAVGREMVEVGIGRLTPAKRIITDGQGRFVFHELGAGIYTFNTTATGYLDGAYGQRRPSGPAQPFFLAEDQRVGNVTIRLWREASMGGTVTDDAGEPVVAQTVTLQRRNQNIGRTQMVNVATTRTDDRGVYRFAKLLPGDYRIVITSTINSVPVPVAVAYVNATAAARGGNAANSPVYQSISTSRGPTPTASAMQVGDALIQIPSSSALPTFVDGGGRVRAYPTTYYPNTTTAARASIVTVDAGDERNGLDIQVHPVPLVGITGTLTGANGPEPHFGVRLVSAEEPGAGSGAQQDAAATTTDGSGNFSFIGVVPGQYVLKAAKLPRATGPVAQVVTFSAGGGGMTMTTLDYGAVAGRGAPPLPTDPVLWAEAPVSVGEDSVTGIQLQLQVAPTVSGRMVFEGATQPTADKLQVMGVSLMPAIPSGSSYCCPASRVSADGRFDTQGYPPDKYYLTPNNVPAGWSLKSVTAVGKDVVLAPLTLDARPVSDVVFTFSDTSSEISGVVNDQTGKTAPTASVVLFPASFQAAVRDGINPRLVRLSRPSPQTGTYRFLNVVPGDYLIVAADDLALEKWPDPDLMSTFAGVATRITVGAGEKKKLDVTTRRP
jgi:hypothetical protein